MNSKVSDDVSKFDSLKWLVVIAIVAVGVVGNSVYANESLLYRVLALVALAIVAGFVALQTAKGKAFFRLFKEAKNEIRKVVWPTRQETLQTTLIVVVAVLIVGLLLWGLDSLLGWVVSGFIG
ncbi:MULTISPECIES: preprotein translocase subunit SecE [unclassified Marinobacterium]|uniref:preprotein translocase subunit SecE n=1 Tax=unclassified Marinobacterium TaxID=2644139 RepID=UPI00156A1114|nr:preprotein translocase subunit SecE [Marinobacterium sp. xm-g-48]NRP14684.1 preprotein translocase subunit SecE [Marinobacterium sp. xm-a-152]NRP27184.1 preprotein translocase subunit SecE [Marinobacterium sp. xm-d-420]NRP36977.1 preprotein translocase subunit SecE [Marinobacterium sp. xm-d-579]NRP38432.1 preprotein translocase subunit SecE [Marinobacterium sp. xm-a-121]NRP46869.1 preprotein translocase subunit SecE [Marinobacterium sp. xm-d-543]NRP52632.1 preprotein translocase subunit Se